MQVCLPPKPHKDAMQPPSKIASAENANPKAPWWGCVDGDTESSSRGRSTSLAALLWSFVQPNMQTMVATRLKAAWAPYLMHEKAPSRTVELISKSQA